MDSLDIENWVKQSPTQNEKIFREAIHLILLAISISQHLQPRMIFHGGLLLTLRYKGIRHTTDIDFTTSHNRSEIDENKFLIELNKSLSEASDTLSYGLDCRIQSHRINPPGEDRNYQTLQITVGYAYKGTNSHKRLMNKNCSDIIDIDYSYNELNNSIDFIQLKDKSYLNVYSLHDLIAEKYRSIIQQKERNRYRRQDAFDIYWMLKNGFLKDKYLKTKILSSLINKSSSRRLSIEQQSLRDKEIIRRSQHDYETLATEIEDELPPFNSLYKAIQDYYESLPW